MTQPAIAVLGIDLGKNRCSLAWLDRTGASYCVERSREKAWLRSRLRCPLVLLPWRHAAELASWDALSPPRATWSG
jgi:hypothetical protein